MEKRKDLEPVALKKWWLGFMARRRLGVTLLFGIGVGPATAESAALVSDSIQQLTALLLFYYYLDEERRC